MFADALHELIADELRAVGIKAQDEIDESESWLNVSDVLGSAWRELHSCRYDRAADLARSAKRETTRILEREKEAKRGAGR